jgi:hypothetical protein
MDETIKNLVVDNISCPEIEEYEDFHVSIKKQKRIMEIIQNKNVQKKKRRSKNKMSEKSRRINRKK